jgi:hypothetical protein
VAQVLYSAKAADGSKAEGFIEAATAQQARELLQQRGLQDIVLHQDMSSAGAGIGVQGLSPSEVQALASFRIRAMRSPGLGTVWAEVARRSWMWLLLDAALVAWGLWKPDRWIFALGALLLVLPFAISAWNYRHAGRYRRLIQHEALGQWDQVARLASQLQAATNQAPQLAFDLDVRLAAVQARRGALDAAVESLQSWRPRLAKQPGVFEGRLGSVHLAGGDTAAFVRLSGESLQGLPGDPARTVDHALAHARFGEVARAAELLASIDTGLLPPHGQGFVLWVQGLVQRRRGQPEAAATLGQAVAEFLQRAEQPAVWTALAVCTADHALALHDAGQIDAARRQVAQVWPVLRVHANKDLQRELIARHLVPTKSAAASK